MRVGFIGVVAAATLLSTLAHASVAFDSEKIKTGILPSGGFYSLYEVDCDDKVSAQIASMDRSRRWCVSYDGEMSCFFRKKEAAARACLSGEVAVADDNLKGIVKYQ